MNRILFAIALLAFLYPVCARAQDEDDICGTFDSAWQTCSRNHDCVLTTDACGEPVAYNRLGLILAQHYNKCIKPTASCTSPPSSSTVQVGCTDGVCTVTKVE